MQLPRYSAVATIALCASLALSACSSGLTSSGITVSKPKETASAPPSSTNTESDKKDDSEKKPDSAPAPQPSTTAQPAPDGWMMVTTTITPVSFAVPDDWLPIGANVSEEEARANAARASLDMPDQIESLMKQRINSDIIYATSNPDHFGDNIQVFKEAFPPDEVNPERLLADQIRQGATITSTRKEQSALGEVTIVEVDTSGAPMTLFVVPANERESLLFLSLSLDKDRLSKNVRTIVSTLTK